MINRQIAFSLLSIFAVLTLVSGVTFALFSSAASNNGNTFGAGTLTLKINGAGGSSSTPVFNVSSAAPGDTSSQVIELSNAGTIAAASTKLTSIGLTPSPTPPPNLGDKLTLDLYNDVNDNGSIDGGDTLINSAHLTDASWTNLSLGFALTASGHHKVIAKITFDSDADNTYQGTGASFNFNFLANQ